MGYLFCIKTSVYLADALSLQAYKAEFHICPVLAYCFQTLYSNINNDSLQRGIMIANIAFDMYFSDVKAIIVAMGVNANIQEMSTNVDDFGIGFIEPKDHRASLAI